MRKPDLAAEIADQADIPVNKANDVLSAILDEITNALSREELEQHRQAWKEVSDGLARLNRCLGD